MGLCGAHHPVRFWRGFPCKQGICRELFADFVSSWRLGICIYVLDQPLGGSCQTNQALCEAGRQLASAHDQAQPFQVVQNQPRNDPVGGDDVHPVSAVAAEGPVNTSPTSGRHAFRVTERVAARLPPSAPLRHPGSVRYSPGLRSRTGSLFVQGSCLRRLPPRQSWSGRVRPRLPRAGGTELR